MRSGLLVVVAIFSVACTGSSEHGSANGGTAGTAGSMSTGGVGANGGAPGGGGTGGTSATGGGGIAGCPFAECGGYSPLCCDGQGNLKPATGPPCSCPHCQQNETPAPSGWNQCPKPGGCGPGVPCAADEFCDVFDWNAFHVGTCAKRPTSCADDGGVPGDAGAFVCACSPEPFGAPSHMFASECVANSNGLDVCPTTSCEIACGSTKCLAGLEYCEQHPDAGTDSCKPLPSGCADPPTCGCLNAEPCGGATSCKNSDTYWIQLSCSG